jgi:iron-sulfur cluster repair protein YtfE (RIC family)
VADLLLACHERIRRFAALAERIGAEPPRDDDAARAEIADAATSVRRYFTVALPLHVADEDRSLLPRLRAVHAHDVEDALAAMAEQHVAIEELIVDLSPVWQMVALAPSRHPDLAPALLVGARRLRAFLEPHLVLEETRIIPALSRLPHDEAAALRREMQERRALAGQPTEGQPR